MDVTLGMHPLGPTPGIKHVYPLRIPRGERCEMRLHVGLFFDGTGNNKDWQDDDGCTRAPGTQLAMRKQSNVARLFAAYRIAREIGYYPIYIEGLGTPCPAIGEDTPFRLGGAMAEGGEGRIHLALLRLLNTLMQAGSPGGLARAFDDDTITALCRNGPRARSAGDAMLVVDGLAPGGRLVPDRWRPLAQPEDGPALAKVRRSTIGGLLMDGLSPDREDTLRFYQTHSRRIAEFLKTSRPTPVELTLDVFGFSRGAAEARVFCSWLCELAADGMLCGVPLTIRFLGLFDTVASVGAPNAPALTHNLTNGHMAWAQPAWLRIPPAVKNCLHLVAMHENRASFPVELVHTATGLPANCQEFAFPGMHSDVGGGYLPKEQGRGTIEGTPDTCDSDKLSQVALSIMLHAAQEAGSPLQVSNALIKSETGVAIYNPFAVHASVQAAYENFHRVCGHTTRKLGNWLLDYLAWRYQVLAQYTQLPWYARASASDRDDLTGANAVLRDDIAALDHTQGIWKATWSALRLASGGWMPLRKNDWKTVRLLAPEAREILQRMRGYPRVSEAEAHLFGRYAHDSVAGFRPWDHIVCHPLPPHWDTEGYLRYRRFWTGDNQALTLLVAPPDPDRALAADSTAPMPPLADRQGHGIEDGIFPGGWS